MKMSKAAVEETMERKGTLLINANYNTVELDGYAVCDTVKGANGEEKLRAKFGHGIKAILSLTEYGEKWFAIEPTDEEDDEE